MKKWSLVILYKDSGEVQTVQLPTVLEAYNELTKRDIKLTEANYFNLGLGGVVATDKHLVFIKKKIVKVGAV